ncbi:MAG: hypothetical protein ACXAEX_04370 [Promethearchaeota archaeon]|jgi:Zn finger protein HypA/HybF involved in hydrogenase expression
MNEKLQSKTTINWCRYCGCIFSEDILRNIAEHNAMICESCGTEIKKSDINLKSGSNELDSLKYQKIRNKSKIYSYLSRIYKSLRNRKGPIVKVLDDSNFPLIFKENFMVVVCRLIYYNFKILEQEDILNPNNVEFSKDLIDRIYEEISPILTMRVIREFLDNLFKISVKEFEKWLQKLQAKIKFNKRFRQNFITFLRWLISEVKNIITEFWSQTDLPKFERIIRDDLKSYPFFFNSSIRNTGSKQRLINDMQKKVKECGKCHQILPYDRFYSVSKGSEKVRAYCKQCNSDISLIRQNSKKLNIILLKYNGKCSECGIDISVLPALQFHHQDSKKKTISWRNIKDRSYDYINKRFEEENIEVLCSNCHNKHQALVFNKYSTLILQQNLTLLTPEEINFTILNSTKDIPDKLDRMHLREKIREWIKKRYVIEQLYDGKCIGCGDVSVLNNLTALEFHHSDVEIDYKLKWESLEILDTVLIIEQLVSQKCLCLCSNCHSLIHSRFNEFAFDILNKFYSEDILNQKIKIINRKYHKIFDNISRFVMKHKALNVKPLLKLTLPHTDSWKIHLLKIFYFSEKFEERLFKAYDLEKILNISIRHIYKHLNRFIKQGYIEKPKLMKGKFRFTDSGLAQVKKIENNYKSLANKIKISIIS